MNSYKGTKNFSIEEMRCKDGTLPKDMSKMKQHAEHMQTLREWYCKPMTVNSWYRSPSHNAKIGGAKASQHLTGNACDISIPVDIRRESAKRKQEWVKNMCVKWHSICGGGGGFGVYDTFIHFDSRPNYVNFDYRKTTKNSYKVVWK